MGILSTWKPIICNDMEAFYKIHKEAEIKQKQTEITERKIAKQKTSEASVKNPKEDYKKKFNDKEFIQYFRLYQFEKIITRCAVIIEIAILVFCLIVEIIYAIKTGC